MPYLFCQAQGPDREEGSASHQEEYRQEGETVLVVEGTLTSGPWQCDSCNAQLNAGDRAWLITAFPAHCHDDLYDYAFDYERGYFAMAKGDRAASYGADWPDDSLIRRRKPKVAEAKRQRTRPLCALDLFHKK